MPKNAPLYRQVYTNFQFSNCIYTVKNISVTLVFYIKKGGQGFTSKRVATKWCKETPLVNWGNETPTIY